MSKKFKGFLVTFDEQAGEEAMEDYKMMLHNIKGVHTVTPYVKGIEDHMSEKSGYMACCEDIHEFIQKKIMQ